MWQKCPVCNGGARINPSASGGCKVCGGAAIINEITGRPPRTTTGTSTQGTGGQAYNDNFETTR